MADEWERLASKWDTMPGVKRYNEAFLTRLDQENVVVRGKKILDFGCGTGLLTEMLKQRGAASIVAVDFAPKMIEALETKVKEAGEGMNGVKPLCLDLTESTVETLKQAAGWTSDNAFDIIVASSSLGFCPDYEEKIKLLTSLLRNDGGVLMHTDWEAKEGDGLNRAKIQAALNHDPSHVAELKVDQAFSITSGVNLMEPIMGFLKKK